MSIKSIVTDAVAVLLRPVKDDTPKEQAVRKLGIAYELAAKGDKGKKDAKKELLQLGVIMDEYAPGTTVAFDSERYRLTTKTSEPAERLDQALLRTALAAEGVSTAKINRAIAAATTTSKAATSFSVELK